MQKEDVHILIVDDDATLGKSLSEALTRQGLKATHIAKPDEVLKFIKLQAIQLAIVDCMLPKMNGRDLTKAMRQAYKSDTGRDLPVILMSGIYKDRAFAREATQQTGAINFMTKPFELKELFAEVNKVIQPLLDPPLVRLQQFLMMGDLSPKERIACVDEADTVHGFDLPWIFSLLMHKNISGHLNIISADGDVAGVGFQDGAIVQVYQEDLKSYFGVLLVEHGCMTQSELDDFMKNAGGKKLGERLVESNLISPHMIEIVMAEQQGIRLSSTIANTSVKVNFIESDEMRVNSVIDRSTLIDLINEWLTSKFTDDWLKSYYVPWQAHGVKQGAEWASTHRVFSTAAIQRVPDVAKVLLASPSLDAAQIALKVDDARFYRAVHALVVSRVVRFSETAAKGDYDAQRNRLKKLNETLAAQNYFERLGVSQKAKDSEFKRAYFELAKVLHPDKLPQDAPADVRDLTKQTFEKISAAYNALTDAKSKEQYIKELEKGDAESQLQAESLSEQARTLLTKGDIKKAREALEQAIKLAPPRSETKLLHIWARLKTQGAAREPGLLTAINEELGGIPPEDRHNALFFFVRGIFMATNGDLDGARRNFDHVLNQNPDFIEARRELQLLAQAEQSTKTVNLFSGDLKDVVGMLFKKKK